MKRWLIRHPLVAAFGIGFCSGFTGFHGFGHIVSIFGWEVPLISAAEPFFHLALGIPLFITGCAGAAVAIRFFSLDDRRRNRGDWEGRGRASQAIWKRAKQNFFEETRPQGR